MIPPERERERERQKWKTKKDLASGNSINNGRKETEVKD